MNAKQKALKHLRTPIVWENLTAKEKRIAVAKDILAAITAGKFTPSAGYGYLDARKPLKSGPLREQLANARGCNGCALAASFFCLVARDNQFDIQSSYEGTTALFFVDDYRHRLLEVFEQDQLEMIESAYETVHYGNGPHVERAISFGHAARGGFKSALRHDTSEHRSSAMVAIFENIVANGGEFVP